MFMEYIEIQVNKLQPLAAGWTPSLEGRGYRRKGLRIEYTKR